MRVIAGFVLLGLVAASALAAPISKLAPPEIQSTFFTGEAFTATTPSGASNSR